MKNFLLAYILGFVNLIIYWIFVKKLVKNQFFFLALFFLLISPWFIQLIIFGIELKDFTLLDFSFRKLLAHLVRNTSIIYLFFQGDKRIDFGTQETGFFYLFQILLITVGFYQLFDKLSQFSKKMILWLGSAILVTSFFKISQSFSISLLYLLPLQIISLVGLMTILRSWLKASYLMKFLIVVLLLLALYEIILYFHILLVHYPKRLLLK